MELACLAPKLLASFLNGVSFMRVFTVYLSIHQKLYNNMY